MSEKRKLFVFDDVDYAQPFLPIFDVVFANNKETFEDKYEESDCVLFTGGSDVGPHLYNETQSAKTSTNPARDKFEVWLAKRCISDGKMMLGICRGAQFLCVMAGGKLIQDVQGHTQSHGIDDIFGNHLVITSTHHQMMRPKTAVQHVMIAWTSAPRSGRYEDGIGTNIYHPYDFEEPEIVHFPLIKGLAIQGHPEASDDHDLHKYCCDLVDFYLFGNQEMKQPFYPPVNPAV